MIAKAHLLLDLDGTILGLDIERFLPIYMAELSRYALARLELADFPGRFAQSVQDMLSGHPGKTNAQAFAESFYKGMDDGAMAACVGMFEDFYREAFPGLRALTGPVPHAQRLIAAATARGFRLTLATSPVFPRVAIEERLRWAGIDPASFGLITSIENCCYAKPDPRYYLEVLAHLGAKPEEALMIGNDLGDDGAAATCGIDFAFVSGAYARGRSDAAPVWQGSMGELAAAIERGELRSDS